MQFEWSALVVDTAGHVDWQKCGPFRLLSEVPEILEPKFCTSTDSFRTMGLLVLRRLAEPRAW